MRGDDPHGFAIVAVHGIVGQVERAPEVVVVGLEPRAVCVRVLLPTALPAVAVALILKVEVRRYVHSGLSVPGVLLPVGRERCGHLAGAT